jgi:hypothetical protein
MSSSPSLDNAKTAIQKAKSQGREQQAKKSKAYANKQILHFYMTSKTEQFIEINRKQNDGKKKRRNN